jgi:fido (protein-threonine AMPylation protein)
MSAITVECPPWEYSSISGFEGILARHTRQALIRLRELNLDERTQIGKDTRPLHRRYFEGLTPAGFDYYAGHYRGEDFPCLKDRQVQIVGDPLVGHAPYRITDDMSTFAGDFTTIAAESDLVWGINPIVVGRPEKLFRVVQLGVALFIYFLEIHPYLNGNGHMGRFLLISFLSRFGIFLSQWPLHPRPQDPHTLNSLAAIVAEIRIHSCGSY